MYSILRKNRENRGNRHDELKMLSDNSQVRSLGYGGHSFNGFELNLFFCEEPPEHPPPLPPGLNRVKLDVIFMQDLVIIIH